MGVMDHDINPGRIAPPRTAREASRASDATWLDTSLHEVRVRLERMLQEARAPTCSLQEMAGDGSLAVDSMVATWLISQVGELVGETKLVKLAKVPDGSLRSTAGLAQVVWDALRSAPRNTVSQ